VGTRRVGTMRRDAHGINRRAAFFLAKQGVRAGRGVRLCVCVMCVDGDCMSTRSWPTAGPSKGPRKAHTRRVLPHGRRGEFGKVYTRTSVEQRKRRGEPALTMSFLLVVIMNTA
jgi:hypothetical protein